MLAGIKVRRRRVLDWAGWISVWGVPWMAHAAPAATGPNRAGVADFVDGEPTVSDAAGNRPLRAGTVIFAGQTIETPANAEVHLTFDDGGYLAVRPRSRIQIDQVKMMGDFDDSLSMTLLRGALRSITGWIGKFDRNSYQLKVGTSTVGIRGTDHEVALIAQGEEGPDEVAGVHSWVNSGGTTLKNAAGSIDIEPGHAAWVGEDGRAPRAHNGIPAFLQRRRTRQEERATRHSLNIRDIIETRLRRRGLLKRGERLEDAQRRHRLLHKRWERRQE